MFSDAYMYQQSQSFWIEVCCFTYPYFAGSFTIAHSVVRAVVGFDWRNEQVMAPAFRYYKAKKLSFRVYGSETKY